MIVIVPAVIILVFLSVQSRNQEKAAHTERGRKSRPGACAIICGHRQQDRAEYRMPRANERCKCSITKHKELENHTEMLATAI